MKIILSAILILTLRTSSLSQCNSASNIDNDFADDCPSCKSIPCNLNLVNYASVTGVNYHWVCIFEDEFEGNSLDGNKWITPDHIGDHRSDAPNNGIDYNSGTNFIFDHPGIELVDSYVNPPEIKWPVDYDHTDYPQQSYNYISSYLNSQYQFPLFGNPFTPPYGIYELTCTLPPVQYYTGGPFSEPPYGMIWPAFWMWGEPNYYGEIDGFEFPHYPEDDFQTEHYPNVGGGCEDTYYANNTFPGQQHTYYIIYTPDEIDWYVDGTLTRSSTKYYGEDNDLFSDAFVPYYSPVNSDYIDDLYQDCSFP